MNSLVRRQAKAFGMASPMLTPSGSNRCRSSRSSVRLEGGLRVVSRPQRLRALTDRSWSKQTFTVHPGYRSAAGAMAGAAEEGGPVTRRLCHPAWYSSRRPVQAEGRAQQDGDDRQSGQDQEDHPVSFREQKWVNADERQGSRVQRVKNCPSVYSPLG